MGDPSSEPGWLADAAHSDVLQDTVAGHDSQPASVRGERPLERGDQFGRYVLLDRVGRGACGTVYAAYDARLDRRVALKVIDRSVSEERGETLKMQSVREAQALAKLSHANVVTVHDVDEQDGRLFIAMEFIEGHTLDHWCKSDRRPWAEILSVLLEAGRGLLAVHGADLVHRDFKPGNVMVQQRNDAVGSASAWRARVMDFGLAQRAGGRGSEFHGERPEDDDTEATWNGSGGTAGTPAYMAPEQHLGLDVGPAADQFSFCVTAYEALYGRRPYDAQSIATLAAAVTEGAVVEPPRDTDVPEHIWPALHRGLQPLVDDRWPSMADLLGALSRPPRSKRRHRIGFAALTAAILTSAAALWLWPAEAPPPDRCGGAAAPVDALWNAEVRARLERDLKPNLRSDVVKPVLQRFDEYARQWKDRAEHACRTEASSEEEVRELRHVQACLDLRLTELSVWLEILDTSDPGQTRLAADALDQSLTTPKACDDPDARADRDPAEVSGSTMQELQPLRESIVRGLAYQEAGRFRESVEQFDIAVKAASDAEVTALLADALLGRGEVQTRRGEYEAARSDLARAYRLSVAERRDHTAMDAAFRMAFVLGESGAPVEAIDAWGQHALGLSDRLDEDRTKARVYEVLATAHAEVDPRASAEYFEQALEAAKRAFGPTSRDVSTVLLNCGVAALRRGENEAALEYLQRADEVIAINDGPDTMLAQHARRERAAALAAVGNTEAALTLGRENLASIERTVGRDTQLYGLQLTLLAHVACGREDFEACRDYAERAMQSFERSVGAKNQFILAPLGSLAEARFALGEHEAALQACAQGLALSEELGATATVESFKQLEDHIRQSPTE